MTSHAFNGILDDLIPALCEVRDEALKLEQHFETEVNQVAPGYRESARNLLHYLSLRRHDLRDLQRQLTTLGLSSLGRMEAHTLAALDSVLTALHRLGDRKPHRPAHFHPPVDFESGPALLQQHTDALLGETPKNRHVRVMVTMPSEAATDPGLVHGLVAAGMDVMRINCAHDDASAWEKMVANLRRAEKELGRSCKVSVDLAGPKLRTGDIEAQAKVLRFGPRCDVMGAVTAPAWIWLTPAPAPQPPPKPVDAVLQIEGELLAQARPGDAIEVLDCRWRQRKVRIVEARDGSALATAVKTTYLAEGADLRLRRKGRYLATGRVVNVPAVAQPLLLRAGDQLIVTHDDRPGRHAVVDAEGRVVEPARISCTLGDAFDDVKPGHRIYMDDGKIAGRVTSNTGSQIAVEITHTPPRGAKLRADKGINLPDTDLDLPALTAKDLQDLDFAVQHADIVSLSFVRRPQDIYQLEDELAARGGTHLGVVLKIETKQGFDNLPRLLLAALRSPPVGVMVARGDLAVEVGFDRLAEVQEEILWLCEAAHVPVIWATQVLENLAQTGFPSRAEVTDAAMAVRAECVMLNKGPYIVDAVKFLCGILERMQDHQQKKRAMLRKLGVSQIDEQPAEGKTATT